MSFFVLKDDDAANEWIGVIAVHVSDMNGGQKCDRENENDNKNKTKTKIKKQDKVWFNVKYFNQESVIKNNGSSIQTVAI